jgi:hypothetical protein
MASTVHCDLPSLLLTLLSIGKYTKSKTAFEKNVSPILGLQSCLFDMCQNITAIPSRAHYTIFLMQFVLSMISVDHRQCEPVE